uniref:Uncharacterized protein n=1 Tax=Anguilla anguilla TaxID=7936 RepID=A0A0E9W5Y8_ANGAN
MGVLCGRMEVQPTFWRAVESVGFRCYSVLTVLVQLKQSITQLTHLTWFLGSKVIVFKVKTKTNRPCASPGPGLATSAVGDAVFQMRCSTRTHCGY